MNLDQLQPLEMEVHHSAQQNMFIIKIAFFHSVLLTG